MSRNDNYQNERIEKIIDKYKTSEAIQLKIIELEKNIQGNQIKELETLHNQYRLLKQHEKRNKHRDEDGVEIKEGSREVEYGKKSLFYDIELNGAGIKPSNLTFNKLHSDGMELPYQENVNNDDDIPFPSNEKPQFYRIKNKSVYSNE